MKKPCCPRCGEPLVPRRYDDFRLEACVGCTGLWIPLPVLRPLIEAMARDLLADMGDEAFLEPLPDPGDAVPCPCCGRIMEHFGYLGAKVVHLDRCDPCRAVWLDPDELYWVAALYARTDARRARLVKSFEEGRRERDELLRAYDEAVRKVTRRRLGWFLPGASPD